MSAVAAPTRPFAKAPGAEPLPGYRLIAPLGRGGFGEVWKCEVPGGLPKAIKFVLPDKDNSFDQEMALRQEFEAFEHIKLIRHPFLLMLERVEIVGGELLMVMELADHNLRDRFKECRRTGQPGVPRDELLGYLTDVAEALDTIATRHTLQHLDVKPGNLFLVGGHAKLGDFGLVQRMENGGTRSGMMSKSLTPRYVAPEVIDGTVHPRSDQYSLALVYHEMLTGTFPYAAKNIRDLILMHSTGVPDLTPLPFADRYAVSRAMSKQPHERFPSCLAFLRALLGMADATADSVPVTRSGLIRHMHRRVPAAPPPAAPPRPVAAEVVDLTPTPSEPPTVRVPQRVMLPRLRVVTAVARLTGIDRSRETGRPPAEFLESLMAAMREAAPAAVRHPEPLAVGNGKWACRFASTEGEKHIERQLTALGANGELHWAPTSPGKFVVYKMVTSTLWAKLNGTADSMVVNIWVGEGGVGEMTGEWLGRNDTETCLELKNLLTELQARFQPRSGRAAGHVGADRPVRVYPVDDEGGVWRAVPGTCRNVSADGVSCVLDDAVSTAHGYCEFPDVPALRGQAILTRLLRAADGTVAGQFFTAE